MVDRFERLVSSVLTMAAVIIAVTLVHNAVARPGAARRPLPPKAPDRIEKWDEIIGAGRTIGNPAARIKVVEFGDYECPFCRRFEEQFRSAQRGFPSDVALIFIDLPLRIHRFATPAARIAACGDAQGKFAAIHRVLYEKQDSLGLKSWTSYAIDAGIRDTAAFARCAVATKPVLGMARGQQLASELDVHATPTIVIDGWRMYGAVTDSVLVDAVTGILAGRRPASARR
jgi:protein-disulfide isomerase